MHPRTKNNFEKFGLHFKNDNIIFSKPFGFFDYIKLQMNTIVLFQIVELLLKKAQF